MTTTSCGLFFAGLTRWVPRFANSVWRRRQLSTSVCSSLESKILGLKKSGRTRSATAVIQASVDKGHKVSALELRRLSHHLLKSKRFNHALQILTWMEARRDFRMSPGDHAMRLESIIKVKGMSEGEEYFLQLTDLAKKAACLPLLRCYVLEKNVERAEALMLSLGQSGLVVSPHPYNEMMKLYMGTSQFGKVPLVIVEMKRNKIPLTVLSYNIWINACVKLSEVGSVEMVYKEMVSDENVEVGWSTLSIMANLYLKEGLLEKSELALRNAETKLSNCNRLGYFFLITQYTSLKRKEDVSRLWEASKAVPGRIPRTNYMHILSCLVKLGEIVEAERVFREWESEWESTRFRYDVRVSNVLLGAYVRSGMVDKAELLHQHTLARGGCPNYKTWEILMEGRLKSQNMDKVVEAMKQGFSLLQDCHWRPSDDTVMAFSDYFERHQNLEDANWYIRAIHNFGFASLPLYKTLLRMHFTAQRSASDILRMMEVDKIEMDDETSDLVQALRSDCNIN